MEVYGSTSLIKRVRPGYVVKEPLQFKKSGLAEKVSRCFSVEPLILERLGQHPRIVKCGVVHSDLRPRNFLVHETREGDYDLPLCDFGGATCDELNLDGGCLPDGPFYNPEFGVESVPALDIFSLGSLFYNFITGHWPHRLSTRLFATIDERVQ